ncbi:MAG: hypothetical protein IBJ04_05730 [Hydrogenophaga sp.]|uniref:hypothetical protein n=1 Tax=unclassified Hydrogenophaga TaxID=2610897 RepID=UPI002579A9C8|nr:hypothetical protein [Hydrogenophaga sp.]MBL0943810.1 hypothetical protein [Hydrogenophaga sp.]
MRRSSDTPARSPARSRLHFEGRSVQLIAAWTLAMGGLTAAHNTLPSRHASGGASTQSAPSAATGSLPPLTARLPRP